MTCCDWVKTRTRHLHKLYSCHGSSLAVFCRWRPRPTVRARPRIQATCSGHPHSPCTTVLGRNFRTHSSHVRCTSFALKFQLDLSLVSLCTRTMIYPNMPGIQQLFSPAKSTTFLESTTKPCRLLWVQGPRLRPKLVPVVQRNMLRPFFVGPFVSCTLCLINTFISSESH